MELKKLLAAAALATTAQAANALTVDYVNFDDLTVGGKGDATVSQGVNVTGDRIVVLPNAGDNFAYSIDSPVLAFNFTEAVNAISVDLVSFGNSPFTFSITGLDAYGDIVSDNEFSVLGEDQTVDLTGITNSAYSWLVSSTTTTGYDDFAFTAPAAVPLPAAGLLLGSALVGGALYGRRRKNAAANDSTAPAVATPGGLG